MANAFTRSWEITKLTFDVMKKDKELLLFPILSGIFSLLFIIAMILPSILAFFADQFAPTLGLLQYFMLFLLYLGLAFIATFFNMCVVYTTAFRFGGKNATFSQSIKYAFSKIHLIFMWSLLAATVGILLRLLENMARRAGIVGRILMSILTSILGLMWAIITIFVVPAMVYHNMTPFDAIKKSVEVLKKTWGESLIRYFGLGLAQGLVGFIGIIILAPFAVFGFMTGNFIVGIIFIIVLVLFLTALSIIFGVANSVFNTALFAYADTGRIPMGYNKEIMTNAFKNKKKKGLFKLPS